MKFGGENTDDGVTLVFFAKVGLANILLNFAIISGFADASTLFFTPDGILVTSGVETGMGHGVGVGRSVTEPEHTCVSSDALTPADVDGVF
jgi:hypothetical protein